MISQVFDQLAIALALVIAEAHDGFACRPSTDDALQQLRHVLKSANSSEISKVALSIDIVWTDPDVVDHHYEVVRIPVSVAPAPADGGSV